MKMHHRLPGSRTTIHTDVVSVRRMILFYQPFHIVDDPHQFGSFISRQIKKSHLHRSGNDQAMPGRNGKSILDDKKMIGYENDPIL